MPELPEVETTKNGLAPHIEKRTVTKVWYSGKRLRYPVAELDNLVGKKLQSLQRRAKFLVFDFGDLYCAHLGMSGSFRVGARERKHDHIEITFDNKQTITYHDPRRFGFFVEGTDVLSKMGPEPWDVTVEHLMQKCARRAPIKNVIMDNAVIVGVGNIYAAEALFKTGIAPTRPANEVSRKEMKVLLKNICEILNKAIASGGTTLKDFESGSGKPGYFQQKLNVYGREGQECKACGHTIENIKLAGRSSFFCQGCQK